MYKHFWIGINDCGKIYKRRFTTEIRNFENTIQRIMAFIKKDYSENAIISHIVSCEKETLETRELVNNWEAQNATR